jgi:Fibrobacter succinogenes major domain (Fib_succ_major).
MTENLKVTHYRDGSDIHNVTDSATWCYLTIGAYCWYENNPVKYKSFYGALYNWRAVGDSRNIAPIGWHVATTDDWYNLTYYLNRGNPVAAGGKLTDLDGFAAIPSGYRHCLLCYPDCRIFDEAGQTYYWWTKSNNDSLTAINWQMSSLDPYMGIDSNQQDNKLGFSVRCIKD